MRLKTDIETIYALIAGGRTLPKTSQVKAVLGPIGPSYALLRKWRDPKSPAFPSQHQLLYLLGMVEKLAPEDTAGRLQWVAGVQANWWLATRAEYAAMGGMYLPPFELVERAATLEGEEA